MKNLLRWNEYFRLRQQRNRMRPIFGVPALFGGYFAYASLYEFSPIEPIIGLDPTIVVVGGGFLAASASYLAGAGMGQILWRLFRHKVGDKMDKMDKVFYQKIQTYRAVRGNSPYVSGMENTKNMLKMDWKNRNRQDFYGESIKSVNDYRSWLRRELRWNKEHLGADAKPIRGTPSID